MRKLTALTAIIVGLLTGASAVHADDATAAAVAKAFNALDAAFEQQDKVAIRNLMTSDHVAVTPYYDGPKSVGEVLDSLGDLETKEIPVSKMTVSVLGPDAAMVTFLADIDGSFMGIPLPSRGYVTAIMVRRDGRWLERHYQLTKLE